MTDCTDDARFREVLRRIDLRREQRARRKLHAVVYTIAAASMAMIICVIRLLGTRTSPPNPTVMGATLLSPEAGGYILVAVIAFCAGTALATLSYGLRAQKRKNRRTANHNNDRIR